MNALFQRASPMATMAVRRQASTSAAVTLPKKPFVPDVYHARSFSSAWFSDPSTYPIIIVLSFAGCFIVGATANVFMSYNDVRINPALKHQVIRNWGEKPVKSMTELLASKPNPEGLGVNHAEWKAKKQMYEKMP